MAYKNLSIPLSPEELHALKSLASRDCRRPVDQARFVLLQALESAGQLEQATKTPAPVLEAQPAGATIGR